MKTELLSRAEALSPVMIAHRKRLHQMPELGLREFETALYIRAALAEAGVAYREAGTGTIADINGTLPGKRIALRADIDALSIAENTGLPFASQNPGRMHACGHDVHTAILLAAAQALARASGEIHGGVRLIFQPAEELAAGAKQMIEAGALAGVDEIYCLHVRSGDPAGHISSKPGAIHASSGAVRITVAGKSSHAAHPERGVNPVIAGARLIARASEALADAMRTSGRGVFTLSGFHAGQATNIIPEEALISGTLRALDERFRTEILARLGDLAAEEEKRSGARISVAQTPGACMTVNSQDAYRRVERVARALLGDESFSQLSAPSLGSEDFGAYLNHVPGAKFYLGTGRREGIHTPAFDVDDVCFSKGLAVLLGLSLDADAYPLCDFAP